MATPSIRTILVPLDFEPPSLAALERAVALAAPLGARVVPLHVYTPPSPNPGFVESWMEQHREAARDRAVEATAAVQKRCGLAVEHREGMPAITILRAIDDLDVDLVVMGTHGRRGVGRLLFGSVAERVVRRSDVPVMLVSQPERVAPSPVIVCATDLSAASRAVVDRARSLADATGATLELVHAYSFPLGTYPMLDPGLVARVADEIERWATRELASEARRVGAARRHLVLGDPAAAILELAQRKNPSLLVLGTYQRQGVERLYMGSVAEWVLRRSPHPVLVVPCEESVAAAGLETSTPGQAARA